MLKAVELVDVTCSRFVMGVVDSIPFNRITKIVLVTVWASGNRVARKTASIESASVSPVDRRLFPMASAWAVAGPAMVAIILSLRSGKTTVSSSLKVAHSSRSFAIIRSFCRVAVDDDSDDVGWLGHMADS